MQNNTSVSAVNVKELNRLSAHFRNWGLDLFSFSPFTKPTTSLVSVNPKLIELLVDRIEYLDYFATEDYEYNLDNSKDDFDATHLIKKEN